MYIYLFLFIFGIIILKCFSIKLHIDWRSFLKRGFAKVDNDYGIVCYTGKQGYR